MGASKTAWEEHMYGKVPSMTVAWNPRLRIVTIKNVDKVRRLPEYDQIDFKDDSVRLLKDGEVIFKARLYKGEYSVVLQDNKEIQIKVNDIIYGQ